MCVNCPFPSFQSNSFTAVFQYDSATHRQSDRMEAEVKLLKNFNLTIRVQDPVKNVTYTERIDIRSCNISLAPQEVAENRKRRWSKKYPIKVSLSSNKSVYLFTPTSRQKEDWFRRMRSACLGITSEELISRQKRFFAYMQHYFPTNIASGSAGNPGRQPGHRKPAARPQPSASVQFSNRPENEDEEMGLVSISKPQVHHHVAAGTTERQLSSASNTSSVGTSVDPPKQMRASIPRSLTPVDENGFELIHHPPKDTDWINALAARLCWDVWHEKRWKDWVMTRIQKKLFRVKTPSFMKQLRLTDVKLGNDMPVINYLYEGPKLDLDGIWVYLDVTYTGLFVMTIETKLKPLGMSSEKGESKAGARTTPLKQSR